MFTRPVEMADAEALLAIYNPEVLETTVTFDVNPRELADQQDWIAAHQGIHQALVVTGDELQGPRGARGEVIGGFAAVSPYRDRAGYSTTVESSVYVAREARRLGVGRLLMADLIEATSAAGFHVTAAASAAEALRLRDAGTLFDAIVSDIDMPDMDGLSFARAVRAGGAWADLPMVALTARAEPRDLEHGREAGFTGYVTKSRRDDLIEALRVCLTETVAA